MEEQKKYKLTLEVGGQVSKAEGETMLEALNNLKRPEFIKTKGILRAEYGELKAVRLMNIVRIKRLFGKDFVRQVQAKVISKFLR